MAKKNSNPKAKKPVKAAKARSKPTKQPATPPADTQPKRMSGLSAAAEVLRLAGGTPMKVVDIYSKAKELGLWSPGGLTPAATLNAALIKEIKSKASASRFRKHSRGLFELNS